MKNEMKHKEKKIIVYYVYCPECKKEISGYSTSQVNYNLKLHLEAHKKEAQK